MDKNNPKYESIKAKLLKLQALAEKVVQAKHVTHGWPLNVCAHSMA